MSVAASTVCAVSSNVQLKREKPFSMPVSSSFKFIIRNKVALIASLLIGVLILVILHLVNSPEISKATLSESSPLSWEKRVLVDSGGGYRGPWQMNKSRFLYVDDPTVAVTEKGAIGVAWVDQSKKDIFFQFYGTGGQKTFDSPVNVSQTPDIFSWLPRMIITNDNPPRIYVLWQEIVFSGGTHGGEIYFSRSLDGGKTFSSPVNLSNSTEGDGKGRLTQRLWYNGSLDLAMASKDTLLAAWTEYEGRLWFSRSTDGGRSFSPKLHVAGDDEKPARGPSITSGTYSSIYIAWTVGENPSANIHFARSDNLGKSFSKPKIVSDNSGHSDIPKIATGKKGTVHLVFATSPNGPFENYHIRYARSFDSGQTFETPRRISKFPTSQSVISSNAPYLEIGTNGNIFVMWEWFPDPKDKPRGLGYTVSTNIGDSFHIPLFVPGSTGPNLGDNGSQQGLFMDKLSVNEHGDIAVVNSTFKKNKQSRIWLISGQVTGQSK